MSKNKRLLLALLVYNGNEFLPACLTSITSAVAVAGGAVHVEVIVLDDCSIEPGFSEGLRSSCNDLGFAYYRSPRNLGIPRNMNLGLLWGARNGFDHTVLLNSDIVLPANFVEAMMEAQLCSGGIGSVTPWSNNVSIFSLPLDEPEHRLAQPEYVDWVSKCLSSEFAGTVLNLPSAVGFCLMISSDALRRVGLLDPIFGRGYCEEIDWSLRCNASGLRNVLAPSVFVYHARHGSTRRAGVLAPDQPSVPANEALIDFRYPDFRRDVFRFVASEDLDRLIMLARSAITRNSSQKQGLSASAERVYPQRV